MAKHLCNGSSPYSLEVWKRKKLEKVHRTENDFRLSEIKANKDQKTRNHKQIHKEVKNYVGKGKERERVKGKEKGERKEKEKKQTRNSSSRALSSNFLTCFLNCFKLLGLKGIPSKTSAITQNTKKKTKTTHKTKPKKKRKNKRETLLQSKSYSRKGCVSPQKDPRKKEQY